MATRKSLETLTADDVVALRAAWEAMQALNDDRGFASHAGIHGLPLPTYCHHGDLYFLPWHRAYLYFFELALQDRGDASVGLPWWDWTSNASRTSGMPASIADAQQPDGGPNPLAGSLVTISADDATRLRTNPRTRGSISDDDPPVTQRDPDPPHRLPSPAQLDAVLAEPTFEGFSDQLEVQLHNRVHGWVGGSMSVVPVAAYDPVFWVHHTMIDRIWYLWQLAHPGVGPPAAMQATALAPFPVTVAQMLDIGALGYEYAAQVLG